MRERGSSAGTLTLAADHGVVDACASLKRSVTACACGCAEADEGAPTNRRWAHKRKVDGLSADEVSERFRWPGGAAARPGCGRMSASRHGARRSAGPRSSSAMCYPAGD